MSEIDTTEELEFVALEDAGTDAETVVDKADVTDSLLDKGIAERVDDEEGDDTDEDVEAEDEPKKKKLGIIGWVLIGAVVYGLFAGVLIILQRRANEGPQTPASYAANTENYASEIVTAHNELLSVDLSQVLDPGKNLGTIEKTVATNELNNRIKTMRTDAAKLAALEVPDGMEETGAQIAEFVTFIQDEWIPFWESVAVDIKGASTTDDAFALFDGYQDQIENGQLGDDMRAAFYTLRDAAVEMGWEESSFAARIR